MASVRPARPSFRAHPARRSVVLAGLLLLVAASCGGEDRGGDGLATLDDATDTTAFEAKPPITLVVNNWTASAINVAIAEQLIERHFGNPVVVNRIDDTTEIYDGLADGSLDAILEIWPSDVTDGDRRYFERGEVVDLGPLGPVGKVGWYVPRYTLDRYPSVATWEGFRDPAVAAAFATDGTRPDGRLLGTSEEYRQYDAEIIANLGLPLTVEFSGSEAETLAELDRATAATQPILLYWWTPTAAVAAYDLVNVTLPEVTDACRQAVASGGAGLACDYPEDVLFKASSPSLATKAPGVEAFLRAFTVSTDDQAALLAEVELGGVTIPDAAAAWIVANEATWRPWLEPPGD